jgi:hypothetical protein
MPDRLKDRVKRFALDHGHRTSSLRPSSLLHTAFRRAARGLGYELSVVDDRYPLYPAIDANRVEVLADRDFRQSVACSEKHTLLDVARLANLWNLARMTGPGSLMEVGSYLGGGALHISNACPDRPMYVFDTFSSFRSLDDELDGSFFQGQFSDTSVSYVERLFSSHNRGAEIISGYFHESAAGLDLKDVAFCHLDVDAYEATLGSLDFLADRLSRQSLIVLDDYRRTAAGVDRAVDEFLIGHPRFRCLPMFPGQGLLFSVDLWEGARTPLN